MRDNDDLELARAIVARYGSTSVSAAKRGSPAELVAKLVAGTDGGTHLTADECRLLADLLRASEKPARDRQYQLEIAVAMDAALADRRGEKREAFVAAAMVQHGLSRSQVYRVLDASRNNPDAKAWVEYIINSSALGE